MNSSQIFELEGAHTSGAYPKREVAIVGGEGARVWDAGGREYIDCVGGQGAAILGHAHPALTRALAEQAARLVSCPEIFYNDRRAELEARLARVTPAGIDRFFLCNSGAEAVEGALKAARLSTGRHGIVATMRGFHGRTMGALAATWEPKYREPFAPHVPGVTHVPFDNIEAMAGAIDEGTAAVLVEVIQGEGGVRHASPGYLAALRALCDERGALLVVDEVQSGFGRTGRWFAVEEEGVVPDIMALGKGIGGGVPLGAVALGPRARLDSGSHGSTYGGNPLACAASLAVLDVIEQERLVERSSRLGEAAIDRLRHSLADLPIVREVRGRGLMIGIELRQRVTPLLKALQERRILALPAGPTVLRLLPPLVIEEEVLARVLETIEQLLREAPAQPLAPARRPAREGE